MNNNTNKCEICDKLSNSLDSICNDDISSFTIDKYNKIIDQYSDKTKMTNEYLKSLFDMLEKNNTNMLDKKEISALIIYIMDYISDIYTKNKRKILSYFILNDDIDNAKKILVSLIMNNHLRYSYLEIICKQQSTISLSLFDYILESDIGIEICKIYGE